ncbi:acyl-CoA dehydrogenase family protein [Desulforhabdus amnigena]|jgi:alkylation response protein AidB-like acyl-CoA dehydrogenase|uniref:Cyclohex-1-ene-1-carbonyl-CoA dehydrogenase n=1 Tax=Desulforhabdus amnigena TaxID=40218 RepID=A0A9W6CVW8_9BACT|nr:acyl-CoA dehydrogenase family protein [Desulforhabdus amnigena]NLJ29151.1 acyl-CoA dehydrogenase [Deltaproteobacteria bacterium]GLI32836.1 acyl-CoA dehydrogenase [Desulforhabdus amnigena]
MQYDLTEEQRMLQDMVRRLAKEKVAAGAGKRDEEAHFDWEMVDLLRENGLYGIDFPEEHGGSGAGMLALAIAVEEISKVDASAGLLIADQELGSLPIILAADERQRAKYLPRLASGEHLAAFALTEPVAGSDVARLRCRAVRDGDYYILNGTKTFITNGGVADVVTVYAVTNPDKPTHRNAGVFIVEKGTPGFSVGKKENKLGIRWSDTVELIFEDCRIPAENLLGAEGQGFHIMMKTLDFSRLAVAAQALGIAAGALEYAVAYAKERETFGKPIIQHQGIGFKLADMAMRTEAARQLLYKACSMFETLSKDMSQLAPEMVRMGSMAKCYCSDVAMWVATEAVQVLGGYGYIKEYPVERMMRDAKITQIYEGSNEIQRLVISRTL